MHDARTTSSFSSSAHICADRACTLSAGADPTSHFETLMTDVLSVYERITGKLLDLANYDATRATEEP